jgi:hypothetical protein
MCGDEEGTLMVYDAEGRFRCEALTVAMIARPKRVCLRDVQ